MGFIDSLFAMSGKIYSKSAMTKPQVTNLVTLFVKGVILFWAGWRGLDQLHLHRPELPWAPLTRIWTGWPFACIRVATRSKVWRGSESPAGSTTRVVPGGC